MVKEIQFNDEFYESSDDDEPLSIFSAPSQFDTDEQLVLIACLMLLEQRYRLLQSMSPSQIVDELDEIMDSLLSDLDNMAYSQAENHIRTYFESLLDDFNIPVGYVDMDYTMLELLEDSIDNLVSQLRGELRVKAKYFRDNMSKDTFDVLPNFKRGVRKLIDGVGSNLIHGKEKSKRNVYKFVYGEDKLYNWLTMNDSKVCSWCLAQQSLPPRTIDEMPLDHMWGRCELEPIDYTYSDDYYLMLARGEYANTIDSISP